MKVKSMNMKNSKAEMIEAYNELVEVYKESLKTNVDVKSIEKDIENQNIIEAADEIVNMNILNETIIKKYTDLNQAIELKKKKIKELFDLEAEAHSLIILINAHNEKKAELQEDFEKQVKNIEDELKERKALQKKELEKIELEKKEFIQELEIKHKEKKAELDKERKRSEEEYSYSVMRARKEEDDKFADEKETREKALKEKEEEFEARNKALKEKEDEVLELKKKVEEIPTKIEEAKKEAAEAKEKELGREYGYKKHLYEKEKEYEVKSLEDKVSRLEAELNKVIQEKQELTSKLDNSYLEIKALATETVKSTGGVKIIGNPNLNDNKK